MTHWATEQQTRLSGLMKDPLVTISYWCSDQHGYPANGGSSEPVYSGLIQEISGPLEICTSKALHATTFPHKWKGCRVWIVALFGEVQKEGDKLGALKREILGEILPNECLDDSIGVRIGRKDLSGADLSGADLSGAHLRGAYLNGANLSKADLSGANLRVADLSRANLSGADLSGADLSGAYLSGANLRVADLSRANLSGADLSGANLDGVYLSRADLSRANLSGADLSGAYLSGTYLSGTDFGSSNRPNWLPEKYIVHNCIIILST